jgi:hypothetical protein
VGCIVRGINFGAWSGNVGSRITFASTDDGIDACSFDIAIEGKGTFITWVRINVYGPGLVQLCRDRLDQGVYVQVAGSLMNRRRSTEVRAEQLIFGGAPETKTPIRLLPKPD